MTSSPVKGVGSLLNYASAKAAGNVGDNFAENFTDAFSKASGQQSMALQHDNVIAGNSQVKVNHTDKKGLDSTSTAKTNDKAPKTQDTQTVQDEVQKAGEKLAGKVAEELGVSEEEVKNAMEILGLTMADLLNADNMTQLVLTLEGADMLSLMTDEGLYNSLQNLLGMVKDAWNQLQEGMGISPEELAAIMDQINETEESTTVEQTQQNMSDKQTKLPDGQEDYSVTVEQDGEVVKVSVEVDGNAKTENAEVTTQETRLPEEKAVKASGKEEGNKKDNTSQGDNKQTNLLLENLLNRSNNVVKADNAFQNTMAGNVSNTQDIMNQIMDYMKIQVKADLTQMEIQLHPASLGTVNINISSKAGVITAQFLTQNEAVKAAIESQIVQLKSNFEEQGLKIEAVEVTVESHQFERNLSGEGNSQEQYQGEKKKGSRKINLNEINPEEADGMDEAEQIAVSMMSAGGNTVDYTA